MLEVKTYVSISCHHNGQNIKDKRTNQLWSTNHCIGKTQTPINTGATNYFDFNRKKMYRK